MRYHCTKCNYDITSLIPRPKGEFNCTECGHHYRCSGFWCIRCGNPLPISPDEPGGHVVCDACGPVTLPRIGKHCIRCGYDMLALLRTGKPITTCPECGEQNAPRTRDDPNERWPDLTPHAFKVALLATVAIGFAAGILLLFAVLTRGM